MNIEDINVEKELKIVFMGTPFFSVPVLEGLIENYRVKAVVTQPDKPTGRDGKVISPPIKKVANEHNVLVLQPTKIRNEFEEIIALEPDLIVTCAYGQMLPKELLDYPRYGCVNVHASLLPKLRGGAPIHHAILKGFKKTGITIMYMDVGMDSGDIISQEEIDILDTDTASSLHDKLSLLGKKLLLETMPRILSDEIDTIIQDKDQVTYAPNIKPEDEKIDFNKSKKDVYNQIRGLNSWPGAYCYLDGKRIKVWESTISENIFPLALNGEITSVYKDGIGVKVSNGEVVFKTIQPEGKARMDAGAFARGYSNRENIVGKVFG